MTIFEGFRGYPDTLISATEHSSLVVNLVDALGDELDGGNLITTAIQDGRRLAVAIQDNRWRDRCG